MKMKKTIYLIVSFGVFFLLNLFSMATVYGENLEWNKGKQIFEVNCAGCHPKGSNIIRRGKNLHSKALEKNGYNSVNSIEQIVTNGKNNMSAFHDRLTAEEINQVANYVFYQAENNWKL